MGLVAPPKSAGTLARIRGIVLVVILLTLILGLGFGIVYGIGQAAGGLSVDISIFYGFLLVLVVFGVLFFFGRRKQKRAQAERAEQLAARSR
jgi:bacteriorhodopsin